MRGAASAGGASHSSSSSQLVSAIPSHAWPSMQAGPCSKVCASGEAISGKGLSRCLLSASSVDEADVLCFLTPFLTPAAVPYGEAGLPVTLGVQGTRRARVAEMSQFKKESPAHLAPTEDSQTSHP